ncbi:MAG: class I SAM-dependent methyltransferase [Halioglobus sp.]
MTTSATEINSGWRALLTSGLVYRAVQIVFSEKRSKQLLLDEYILPVGGDCRVLDMGCGPGNLLRFLPLQVHYTGFDISHEYIASATQLYAKRSNSEFICAATEDDVLNEKIDDASIDVAIVHGVFHHINDTEAAAMLALARRKLKPGGVLVALEPVWFEGQSRLRRWVMSLDRGKNIKSLDGWRDFFIGQVADWGQLDLTVHPNLIRFYDLAVCAVRKGR